MVAHGLYKSMHSLAKDIWIIFWPIRKLGFVRNAGTVEKVALFYRS